MKVIFLDVDGVLITAKRCRQGFGIVEPSCVAAVNSLIEQTGAAIVLSSCWRIGCNTRIEVCDLLNGWGVKGKVLGSTPHSYDKTRGEEIQQWLDENERYPVESFVILDDDSDMGQLMPRLVKSTFTDGFTSAHIAEAVEKLRAHGGSGEL